MIDTHVLRQLGRRLGADGDGAGAAGDDGREPGELGTPDDAGTTGELGTPDDAGTTGELGTPDDTGTAGELGTPEDPGTVGGVEEGGAMHLVQIVEVWVVVTVEIVLLICTVGVPPGGVTVLVTGQVVTVVCTLHLLAFEYSQNPRKTCISVVTTAWVVPSTADEEGTGAGELGTLVVPGAVGTDLLGTLELGAAGDDGVTGELGTEPGVLDCATGTPGVDVGETGVPGVVCGGATHFVQMVFVLVRMTVDKLEVTCVTCFPEEVKVFVTGQLVIVVKTISLVTCSTVDWTAGDVPPTGELGVEALAGAVVKGTDTPGTDAEGEGKVGTGAVEFLPPGAEGTTIGEVPTGVEGFTIGEVGPAGVEGLTTGAVGPAEDEGFTDGAVGPAGDEGFTEGAVGPTGEEGFTIGAVPGCDFVSLGLVAGNDGATDDLDDAGLLLLGGEPGVQSKLML